MISTDDITSPHIMERLRHHAKVNQAEFAAMMGMPVRTYEDIVAGRSQFRGVHVRAAEMAFIYLAHQKQDVAILNPTLVMVVKDLAKLIEAEDK